MFSANSSQVSEDRLYVEDVFSTYLYSGTSGAQSINNGIDTLNKGGLVWMKNRGSALSHILIDTAQGCTFAGGKNLISNSTNAAGTIAANTFQFDSTGFSFGSAASGGAINASGNTYASWTFRKAHKFFDVVTWTGDSVDGRQIAHSLGISPGCVIVKRTNAAGSWIVYHRSATGTLTLETTDAQSGSRTGVTAVSDTTFTVSNSVSVNATGNTYVAYLFAHDTTSDGIIQCGVLNAAGEVNLGWDPQWILHKPHTTAGTNWRIFDNMRGMPVGGNEAVLAPNTADAESSSLDFLSPTATGFDYKLSTPAIYIAIRRGPMRTPTSGTSVFKPTVVTNTASVTTTNFPVDLSLQSARDTFPGTLVVDRMRGTAGLITFGTNEENGYWGPITGAKFDNNTGVTVDWSLGASSYVNWSFRRAPSFFDEVCVTSGTGTANPSGAGERFKHNLGVVPEMMIWKDRQASTNWFVYHIGLSGNGANGWAYLNTTDAQLTGSNFWSGAQTATECSIRYTSGLSSSSRTLVGYLFASCPGVSKVGSYTGTGSGTQTINCGFSSGARFVLIKRVDSSGTWNVFDTARGISAGNDPVLWLNSTIDEGTITSNDLSPASSGFAVVHGGGNNLNAPGATYIYLAVA